MSFFYAITYLLIIRRTCSVVMSIGNLWEDLLDVLGVILVVNCFIAMMRFGSGKKRGLNSDSTH